MYKKTIMTARESTWIEERSLRNIVSMSIRHDERHPVYDRRHHSPSAWAGDAGVAEVMAPFSFTFAVRVAAPSAPPLPPSFSASAAAQSEAPLQSSSDTTSPGVR
jgi:hypothetical protein